MRDQNSMYSEVGRLIRHARKVRNLTQQELADRVSLTRTSITNIEKGRQKLLLHTLAEIATALHVPTRQLLPDENHETEQELDEVLRSHSDQEKEWIKSAVRSAQRGEEDAGT